MEPKRRGRPPKLPAPSMEPVLLSMGMEKVGNLYSTFVLQTAGDKVIYKKTFPPDLKISAQMGLHDQIVSAFVNNESF